MTDKQRKRLEKCRAAGHACANRYQKVNGKRTDAALLCGYIAVGTACGKAVEK